MRPISSVEIISFCLTIVTSQKITTAYCHSLEASKSKIRLGLQMSFRGQDRLLGRLQKSWAQLQTKSSICLIAVDSSRGGDPAWTLKMRSRRSLQRTLPSRYVPLTSKRASFNFTAELQADCSTHGECDFFTVNYTHLWLDETKLTLF